ncbi:MAG: HlyD family efflux transporter periplasmic adaptor subunit [Magnetococcales bacterium]|nr:HlyD family efflux transporter periplasmic adaptor subunit [Magnetococcales bacterium]
MMLFLLNLLVLLPLLPGMVHGEEEKVSTQALLEARAKATLSSQIAARILKVTVEEGQSFTAGQLLIHFDCAIPQARLARTQAELRAEQKKLDVNLRMKDMVGMSELEVALARANVERSQAEVGVAKAESDYCEVRAPYGGKVSKRHVNAFDSVGKGEALLDILDDSTLRVRLYIPALWSRWLQTGSSFSVTVPGSDQPAPARVISLGAHVEPGSQTLGVIGEIQGSVTGLLPGLNVMANFSIPSKP